MAIRGVFRTSRLAAGLFAIVLASCSKSQTSPSALCDNEGSDLVAFASDRGHAGQYWIYLLDLDALGFRALRNLDQAGVSYAAPALSRDGQLLAFVSGTAPNTDVHIYERVSCSVLNAPGLATPSPESDPAFSGNSSRLAFVRDTLGHRRVRLANASAGVISNVPLPGLDSLTATYDDWAPSPDLTGDRIAFVSDREGSPHLYLYDRTTGRVDSLLGLRSAEPSAQDLDPALTPNGTFLAFASNRGGGRGGFDIYVVNLAPPFPLHVIAAAGVNTSGNERSPSIGSTFQFIAFESDSTGAGPGRDLRYCLLTSGSVFAPSPLTGASSDDTHPSVRLP